MRASKPQGSTPKQQLPPESMPYVVDSEGRCFTSLQAQQREEQETHSRRLPGSDDEESE